ncbi:MAG: phospho-N-acetylmuramoyl-pentapeptide-transferase [bacterium]|nr:phospho-N-acetylmuramoyl-pentapeptide-transferase [bacterium]
MLTQILSFNVSSNTITEMLVLGFSGFLLSMAITPIYTHFAYSGKWWKKSRENTVTGEKATMFNKLHKAKLSRNIPTMAGLIFVATVTIVTLMFNLSRTETWLPLAAFVGAAGVGLIDDIINIRGVGKGVAGLPSRLKFIMITAVASIGGWYFFAKLDVTSVNIPFIGDLALGWLIIPLFAFVVVATANAVNITDGLDGLAGGLTAIAFGIYAIIAFLEQRYGVAGLCLTLVGALLSYTWFNVFPARFFMGDVGSFALGAVLGVIAMITDTVAVLPLIGIVFVAETGSVIIQIASKKLRNGKKIFKIAPIHHHFEASGWPETKVTMRFWILGQVAAFTGLIVYILG